MKTILFAADYVYLGGGEIELLDLMGALKKLGFRAVLVIPKKGPFYYEAQDMAIDIRLIEMPLINKRLVKDPVGFLKSIVRLMKIIKEEDISYIFANNLNAGMYASIAGKPFSVKSIWYCWGCFFPNNKFWQNLYRFLFDRIVFCSRFVKERMQIRTFGEHGLMVLYPGVDEKRMEGDDRYLESLFKKENGIPEDSPVFTIVGRLDKWKNHLMFLDAAHEIAKQISKSYFIIAGGARDDEGADSYIRPLLEEKIKSLPLLKGRVIFTGFVKDIKIIIKSSKIIFSCSGVDGIGESFGIAIIEAMMAGRPVIATSLGGPQETIVDGFNGFLVKSGDHKAMAHKAMALINSQCEYDRIVNNGKKHAFENYAIEKFAEGIADIFDNMTKAKKKI